MGDQAEWIQQWRTRVHQLYNGVSGSTIQKEANGWLSSFLAAEEAWLVLVQVMKAKLMTTSTDQDYDVSMDFMAAKMLQLKIQQDWPRCPAEIRQEIEQILIAHIQQQASISEQQRQEQHLDVSPIVAIQVNLAFVHLLIRLLDDRSGEGPFIYQLCQVLGIGAIQDLSQVHALFNLLEILRIIPEELKRSRSSNETSLKRSVYLLRKETARMMELIGLVLNRCDEEGASTPFSAPPAAVPAFISKLKMSALQCLSTWSSCIEGSSSYSSGLGEDDYDEGEGSQSCWITLKDLVKQGMFPVLERQVALGCAHALQQDSFSLILQGRELSYIMEQQILSDITRNASTMAMPEEEESPEEVEAIVHICKILIVMKNIPMEVNTYDADEGGDASIVRSICDVLITLLEFHLPVLWSTLKDVAMVGELMALLLSCTAHKDLEGVAQATLETWYYLPRYLDGKDKMTLEKYTLLLELQIPLLNILYQQCIGDACIEEQHWLAVLFCAYPGRLGLDAGTEALLTDRIAFRREAADTIEGLVTSWPEGQRIGPILLSFLRITTNTQTPRALEALLWCLTSVFQSEDMEEDDDEDDEKKEHECDKVTGGNHATTAAASTSKRGNQADDNDKLRLDVLQIVISLQTFDCNDCPSLWLRACWLVKELVVDFGKAIDPHMIEQVMHFLIQALNHAVMVREASRAIRHVTLAGCAKRRGGQSSLVIENNVLRMLISTLTSSLLSDPSTSVVLKAKAEAFAYVSEALVIMHIAVDGSSSTGSISSMITTVLSLTTISRSNRCWILRAIIRGFEHAPVGLADIVIHHTWASIDQSIFTSSPHDVEDCNEILVIGGVCDVLQAILKALHDAKRAFLPVVLNKITPFLHHPIASPVDVLRDILGLLLENGGIKNVDDDLRRNLYQLVDHVLNTAKQALLHSTSSNNDANGIQQQQHQLSIKAPLMASSTDINAVYDEAVYYEAVFLMIKQFMTSETMLPISLVAEDPYALQRGLDLVILGLELPFEDYTRSRTFQALLGYLTCLVRLPEEMALALFGHENRASKLLYVMLKADVSIQRLVLHDLAHLFYSALYSSGALSALFQQHLSILFTSDQGLRSQMDPSIVDWANGVFSSCPSLPAFRVLLKSFRAICRGESTLKDVI